MHSFTVKQMILEDLELAVEWAASEGWNPGLHDAEIFYQTDPRGFFIGKLEDKPVAAISAVRYADDFGFIGFISLPLISGITDMVVTLFSVQRSTWPDAGASVSMGWRPSRRTMLVTEHAMHMTTSVSRDMVPEILFPHPQDPKSIHSPTSRLRSFSPTIVVTFRPIVPTF